ncbi:MAG: hypothetical protein WBF09_08930 [Candidatus Acidiferrum sp.]
MMRSVLRLTRIRMTRSILLDGAHAEEGSIQYVTSAVADDLAMQRSAVRLEIFPRLFSRIRLLIAAWFQKKERGSDKWIGWRKHKR